MTDNEIIKALECCAKTEFISDCAKCEMLAFDCKDILIEYALDLINRQKAEIDRLQKTVVDLNTNLSESINCFTRMESLYKIKCKELEISKSEAIKEFAERLKSEYEDEKQGRYINWLMNDIIDNLVKEMAEE